MYENEMSFYLSSNVTLYVVYKADHSFTKEHSQILKQCFRSEGNLHVQGLPKRLGGEDSTEHVREGRPANQLLS